MPSISKTWGTTAAERELVFPCDRLIARPDGTGFRGVTIEAPARIVFRWLCQMRVAPYSYDWLDNGGRRSPRVLTAGLEELASGQTVMRIFYLVDFAQNAHLTIRLKPDSPSSKVFGDLAVSYLILPTSGSSCRLVVKLIIKYSDGIGGRLMGAFLPWGDLIMMRRQLLNFKRLAEQSRSSSEF